MIIDDERSGSEAAAAAGRSAETTMSLLVERAQEHFFGTRLVARLDVVPLEAPALGRSLHWGPTLTCTPLDEPAREVQLSARLELPMRAFEWLLDHPDRILRNHPDFVAACDGRLSRCDDKAFLIMTEGWFQLLKRPSSAQRAQLDAARAQAPLRPGEGDFDLGPGDLEHAVLRAIGRRSPCRIRGAVNFEGGDCRRLREGPAAAGYTSGSYAPPEVVRAIRWPALPQHAFSGAQIWAGQRDKGPLTRLHCDTMTSLLAHLEGRKHVLLYSPRLHDKLYPMGCFNSFQPCLPDPRAPDFQAFPRMIEAHGSYLELAPGDLLVIPTGWFHYVWADEAVTSVSRFVLDPLLPPALVAKAAA
jgi:hypothetical protein